MRKKIALWWVVLVAFAALQGCEETPLFGPLSQDNRPISKIIHLVADSVMLTEEFTYENTLATTPKLSSYRRSGVLASGMKAEEFTYKSNADNKLNSIQVRYEKPNGTVIEVTKTLLYDDQHRLSGIRETKADTVYNYQLSYDEQGNIKQLIKSVGTGLFRQDTERVTYQWHNGNIVKADKIIGNTYQINAFGFDDNVNPVARFVDRELRIVLTDEPNLSNNNVTDKNDIQERARYRYSYQYRTDNMPTQATINKYVGEAWVKYGEIKYEYY